MRPSVAYNCRLLLFWLLAASGCGPAGTYPESSLRVAAAAVKVTPAVETFTDLDGNGSYDQGEPFEDLNGNGVLDQVWLGGFGPDRPAHGIMHDIWARLLLVEGANGVRLGFVSVDWVGLFYDQVKELEQQIAADGLALDYLVVSSTHNHQSPDTIGLWGPVDQSGRDDDYLAECWHKIAAAFAEAEGRLEPARLLAGRGRTEGLTRDSRLPEAKDERVTALLFEAESSGKPLAVVAHWPNHPEVFHQSNHLITPDFPLALVEQLEAAWPGAVGIYWQGTIGGLLTPWGIEVTDEQGHVYEDNTWEKAEIIGQRVRQVAEQALSQGADITGDGVVEFHRQALYLPLDNLQLQLAGLNQVFRRKIYDEQHQEREPEQMFNYQPHLKSEVVAVGIGELLVVTVPGELYPELSLEDDDGRRYYQEPQDPGADFYGTACVAPIEHYFKQTDRFALALVLGLGNDELGYIIPKCQFDRESPYTYGRDEPQYGEQLSLGPETGPLVVGGIAELLGIMN